MISSRFVHETNTWNNGLGFAANGFGPGLDDACVSSWGNATCQFIAQHQTGHNETIFNALLDHQFDVTIFNRLDMGDGLIQTFPNATGDGFHGGPSLAILARSADIRKSTDVDPINWVNDTVPNPYGWEVLYLNDALGWMQQHDPHGKPWSLFFGILDPHPPYDTNATWLAAVNESAVDVPTWPDREDMHPGDSFASIAKNVWGNYTDEQVRSVRRSYWACVAEADAILGRVLDAAAATGHLDNTIVVFTSDHGEMGMEHRQDLKNSMYEASSRVPLVVASFGSAASPASPTSIPQSLVVTNHTSHIDVVPTILDLLGLPQGTLPHARGYSLRPLWQQDGTPFPRDYATVQFHSNLGNTGVFAIRQGPWKYVTWGTQFYPWFGSNYTDQLFNVEQDPEELANVISANPSVAQAMRATLAAEWGMDPQQVDAAAKTLDAQLYNMAFGGMGNNKLRAAFEKTFQGFDDEDWQRVRTWESLAPQLIA